MTASDQEEKAGRASLPFFTKLIATGFFSGYLPWASGTVGTIVGLLIYLLLPADSSNILFVASVVCFFLGVYTSAKVAASVGHQLSKSAQFAKSTFQPRDLHTTADPSVVDIDEIVGIWIALLLVPKTGLAICVAFIFFRMFDVIKPPPARQLERLPNGWGIMLDDVVAGVYANLSTQATLQVIQAILGRST